MRFTLDQQIIEATLNYLASKLIADIQKDAKPTKEDVSRGNKLEGLETKKYS